MNRSQARPAALLVFFAAFAAFLPVLGNGFVNWDDHNLILGNPHYRGLGPENLAWMFGGVRFGSYAPLSWLSLAFDHALWGMDARGYHLTSLLLHAGTASLFFLAARRLLGAAWPDARPRALTAASALSALLFAVHPLRVESVAWASERRDVLSGLFYLGALVLYLRWAGSGPRQRGWPWASWGVYLLSLLSKGIGITLPAALLIADLYPLRRLPADPRRWEEPRARRVLLEKLLFLAPALPFAWVGLTGQEQLGEISRYAGQGLGVRLAQACYAAVFYLGKTLFPSGLAPIYPRPREVSLLVPEFALAAAAVAAITALLWVRRRSFPAGLSAWAFYLATLAPVSGLVSFGPQIAADRYTYLPCLSLALLAGGGLLRLGTGRAAKAAAWAAALAVVALSAGTWRQSRAWRDDESLWSRSVKADPSNAVVRNFHGNALMRRGRTAAAAERYFEAVSLDPDYAAARNNLGAALTRLGRYEEAVPHLRRAAALRPGHPAAHFNWGVALAAQGRLEEAARQFRAELSISPEHEPSRQALKAVLERLKDLRRGGRG